MNLSNIKKYHRNLWLMSGERRQSQKIIQVLAETNSDDALVVSDEPDNFNQIHSITYKQANELLGQEKSLVIIEIQSLIPVDAIAAVAGLVLGGGVLLLSLPEKEQWHSIFTSNFSVRFLQYLQLNSQVNYFNVTDTVKVKALIEQLKVVPEKSDFCLTNDQECVIGEIKKLIINDNRQSLVVISDRGRGKSSALGMAAARLVKDFQLTVIITAPSFKSSEVAFLHAQKIIENTKLRQARLQYEQSEFRFMAPDELLLSDSQADLVFIDEAAAIPLPILKQILIKYKKTVFASTVHGYEGTGRGFSVKFAKELNKVTENWRQIEMKTPVRWCEGDELEIWLFRLLCLDADVNNLSMPVSVDEVSIRNIGAKELGNNENILRQIFSLLVLAHYRTRPSDLQRMLDDDLLITVAEYKQQIIGVVLSIDEGGFESSLSTAIYRGERRPRGHLLAQTLTYHCGVELAATQSMHRIMRIVVHPQSQGLGIGSQLLAHLEKNITNRKKDILGASFGMTDELNHFWQNNGFELVRIGFKREQSSGERAAVYVKALSESGGGIVADCRDRFSRHLPLLQQTILSDVSLPGIVAKEISGPMSDDELKDIDAFMHYSRGYELTISGVNKWLLLHLDQIKNSVDEKQYFEVIDQVVRQKLGWKSVAKTMGLSGQHQAQVLFKEAVIHFWNEFNPD